MSQIPQSGAISFDDIQDEFGGSNPINLDEYYRNGANVPNTTGTASIPTSGTIELADFYGSSAVDYDAFNVNDNGEGQAEVSFTRSGLIFSTNSIGRTWHENASTTVGDTFQIFASVVLGSVFGSSTNTWLALTTTRSWSVVSFTGNNLAQIDVSIRPVGGSIQNTARITLTAEADGGFGGGF